MSFINKVVLVTGAGSGMGEATALHFAKLSARLTLIDINGDNLKKVADNCEKVSKLKVLRAVVDVSNDEQVKNIIDKTVKEYGRLDVVANIAGIYKEGDLQDPKVLETYDTVLAINLRSVIAITTFAAPALIASKGSIVNVSSVAAELVHRKVMAYSIAKAGMNMFTRGAALELGPKGVRVNGIMPGLVRTNILLNAGMSNNTNEDVFKNTLDILPVKHIIRPDEIANFIAFLASDQAESITGVNVFMDAGMALAPKIKTIEIK